MCHPKAFRNKHRTERWRTGGEFWSAPPSKSVFVHYSDGHRISQLKLPNPEAELTVFSSPSDRHFRLRLPLRPAPHPIDQQIRHSDGSTCEILVRASLPGLLVIYHFGRVRCHQLGSYREPERKATGSDSGLVGSNHSQSF